MHDRAELIEELCRPYDLPGTPGMAVGVVYRGEVLHLAGYGRASLEHDLPWTPDTPYRVASVTKPFLAAAMLILEGRRALSLDDDIRRHLPELPAHARPITIRHLLTMTSGLRFDEALATTIGGEQGPISLDTLYRLVASQDELNFLPGDYQTYCCSNYRLAARIAERMMGYGLSELLVDLVFRPAGMAASYSHPWYDLIAPGMAYRYQRADDCWRRYTSGHAMSGDGAAISTLRDLLAWIEVLAGRRSIGPGIVERMTRPTPLPGGREGGYGLGLMLTRHRGRRVWQHSGVFGAYIAYMPDDDLGVAILANRPEIDRWALGREIFDRVLLDEPPAAGAPVYGAWLRDPTVKAELDWQRLLGSYVEPERGYTLDLVERGGVPAARLFGRTDLLAVAGLRRLAAASSSISLELEVTPQEPGRQAELLVWLDGPAPLRFVTMPDPPAAPTLDGYAGTYVDPASKILVRFEHDGAELILVRGSGLAEGQRVPLAPLLADRFAGGGICVRFEREATGAVAAAVVSTFGVLDLRMVRRSPTPSEKASM